MCAVGTELRAIALAIAQGDSPQSACCVVPLPTPVTNPQSDRDCAGFWSSCGGDCSDRVYSISVHQSGGGQECLAADGDTRACLPGEGLCPSETVIVEPEAQTTTMVQVETRVVGTILAAEDILQGMRDHGQGAEVVSVQVKQEVVFPLQDLPGMASDYDEDTACTQCQVKRFQLKQGAADVANVDLANVKLHSISRRRRMTSESGGTFRRLAVAAEISIMSDVNQDIVGRSTLASSELFTDALQQAAASISADEIGIAIGISAAEAQDAAITDAELAGVSTAGDLVVASQFVLTMAPPDDGDLSEFGVGGTLVATALGIPPDAVEVVSPPVLQEVTTWSCPAGTEEQRSSTPSTPPRCVAISQPAPMQSSATDEGTDLQAQRQSPWLLVATAVLAGVVVLAGIVYRCHVKKLRQEVSRLKADNEELKSLRRQSSGELGAQGHALSTSGTRGDAEVDCEAGGRTPRVVNSTPSPQSAEQERRLRPSQTPPRERRPSTPPEAGFSAIQAAAKLRVQATRKASRARPLSPQGQRQAIAPAAVKLRVQATRKAGGVRPPSPQGQPQAIAPTGHHTLHHAAIKRV